ncbi:MAG: hypothetical protein ABGY24_11335, partial [bacterium]
MCRSGLCMRCVEGRVRAVTARKSEYVLCNVSVPTCCLEADGKESDGKESDGKESDGKEFESTAAAPPPLSAKWDEGTVLVDVHVREGRIVAIERAAARMGPGGWARSP